MAISFVALANSADNSVSTFTITKPAGVAANDFLLAYVVTYPGDSGSQLTVTPPAGWTTEATVYRSGPSPSQLSVLSRTAASSEPGSWAGSLNRSASYIVECLAYRGVAGVAVDGTSSLGSGTSYSTATVNNPTSNNWRVVAAGKAFAPGYDLESNETTERQLYQIGIVGTSNKNLQAGSWDSGGTIATGNTSRTVSSDGAWLSSVSWIGILDASDTTVSGTLTATMPLPVVSASGAPSYDGTLTATMPLPTMTASGIASAPEGDLAATVMPAVGISGSVVPTGTLSVAITPSVGIAAETRRFGIRVTNVEAEARRVVPLLGADTVSPAGLDGLLSLFPMEEAGGDLFRVKVPLPQVSIGVDASPASALEAAMPLPEVLFSGDGGAVFVADYATPQLAANVAAGKRLIFPSNQTYQINPSSGLSIPAGCIVEGNGSTLIYTNNSTTGSSHTDELLKVNGSNVRITGLNLDGNQRNQGTLWTQHRHCVRIHGNFSNVVVDNCNMTDIIGDGVYVNIGASANNVTIGPNNTFSSDYANRNGVSLITGTDLEVYQNTFINCSRSGMPGPIDIEPNFSTEHLTDVFVHDNVIQGGSGAGTGTLPGIVYSGFQNAAANNINIYGNNISGSRFNTGILVIGVNGGPFNAVTNLNIYENSIHDTLSSGTGVDLSYWIGANVYNNTISNVEYGIYNYKACLGTSTGNTFIGVGHEITNDDPHCS